MNTLGSVDRICGLIMLITTECISAMSLVLFNRRSNPGYLETLTVEVNGSQFLVVL